MGSAKRKSDQLIILGTFQRSFIKYALVWSVLVGNQGYHPSILWWVSLGSCMNKTGQDLSFTSFFQRTASATTQRPYQFTWAVEPRQTADAANSSIPSSKSNLSFLRKFPIYALARPRCKQIARSELTVCVCLCGLHTWQEKKCVCVHVGVCICVPLCVQPYF